LPVTRIFFVSSSTVTHSAQPSGQLMHVRCLIIPSPFRFRSRSY
jgi:hypothetical protein